MLERLERMRDLYHKVVELGQDPELDELSDPWHEAKPAVITGRLKELELRLEEILEENENMKWQKERSMGRSLMLWQDSRGTENPLKLPFKNWKQAASAGARTRQQRSSVRASAGVKRVNLTAPRPKSAAGAKAKAGGRP